MVRVYAWNLILHGPSGEGVSQSRVRVSQTLSEAIGQICHVSSYQIKASEMHVAPWIFSMAVVVVQKWSSSGLVVVTKCSPIKVGLHRNA